MSIADKYGIDWSKIDPTTGGKPNVKFTFNQLIDRLQQLGNDYEDKLVILIDAYDRPLIKAPDTQYERSLDVIESFFTTLKSCQSTQ